MCAKGVYYLKNLREKLILKLPHKVNSLIIFRKKSCLSDKAFFAQEYFKLNIHSQINVI